MSIAAVVDALTPEPSPPTCVVRQHTCDDALLRLQISRWSRSDAIVAPVSAREKKAVPPSSNEQVLLFVLAVIEKNAVTRSRPLAPSAPAGTSQPGRDHWPRGFSNIWAGGGITPGRVIGATDPRGEDVIAAHAGPGDFLATIYHHLGIDYSHTFIKDFNGRPTPIVDRGTAIPELTV